MNLEELLTRHRETLVRYFRKHGAYLRRYEASEDLVQGVHLHAVRHRDKFDYRGEPQFVAWLLRLARQHLADRIAHWKALKRDAGPMMRLSFSGTGLEPAGSRTGPITYASRKEQLRLATLAMDGLPPRDREIVSLMTDGAGVATVAERLGVSGAAAQRARLRAMDRFRKIYAIVERKHLGR